MEIVDQVRQAADIVDIASLYTALKRRGRKHVGLCPFHSEKDPSFTVDSEKQLFHCFGCGVGGDVFTLVMEKENLTFPEALQYLAEKYHIPLPQKTRLSPGLQKLEEKVYKINELAMAFFPRCLFQTKEGNAALAYLKKRGLSQETLETLKIGYAPNSWNALTSHFQGRGTEAGLLEKAGLVLPGRKKSEYYDRFRGRVIFPIFGLTGKVVAFGGRTIAEATPKYLNSPDTPVYSKGKVLYGLNWTKEAVSTAAEIILVEGYTDFASLYQAGIRNIVASLGTALTPHQVALAKRFAPRVIINYDGDSAGMNAALRAVSLCFERAVQVHVLILPQSLDPDGYIRKSGNASYRNLIQKSPSGLQFLIDMTVRTGRMDIPEEKSRIIRTIVAELDKIPDAIIRSEYLRQASDHLGVEEGVLRLLIEKPPPGVIGQESALLLPAEKRILQILIENQVLAAEVLEQVQAEDFRGLRSEAALNFIMDCVRKGKRVHFSELSRASGPEIGRQVSEMMQEKSAPGTFEEAQDCLQALRKTALEARLKVLSKEIERSERNGEKEKLARLLSEKQALTRQILAM